MIVLFRIFFFFALFGLMFLLLLGMITKPIRKRKKRQSVVHTFVDEKLREKVKTMAEENIPLDLHELKILAWKKIVTAKKKASYSGYLFTIFQEKLVAFTLVKERHNILINAMTSEGEYHFMKSAKQTMITFGDKLLGNLTTDLSLKTLDGQLTYRIVKTDKQKGRIVFGSRDVVEYDLGGEGTIGDRFFSTIHDIKEDDKNVVIALSLYLMLITD